MWVRTLTFTPKSSSQSHLLQFFRSSPSPQPPPTMPYNNRGRPAAAAREQWKPKTQPSTSAAAPSAVASATDHISRLSIADTADPSSSSSSSATARAHPQPNPPLMQFGTLTPQATPPPLQFGTLTPPARQQRGVWMPKCYGTVSSTPVVEASATVATAPAAQAATPIAIPQKESNIDVSNLSKLFADFKVDNNTFSEAKIRATFYPKFENEKSDQEIRLKMIDVVSHGQGIVEVSLKHSGSLFMYAGHLGGAFAKNSYGNIYTAVGVFVLGRTLRMAWGREAERKQAEFNDFLEKNRMCISMELVTAVLGDHGQRPINDYVVVTAITELGHGKPKFYSTPDLIAFCRQWRLPTNHVWLFSTRKSVTSFFAAYDALCEEGTATPVCKVLDEVADISVPGSKDHIKEQGEILEGLVARIVSHDSSKHMEEVLRDFHSPPVVGVSQDLGPSLREICAANRSDEKQQIKALLENAGSSMCPYYSDWFGNGDASSHSRNADRSVITKFLQAHPMDYSTIKLQEMIRVMRQNNFSVAFKCYYNFHMVNSLSSESLYSRMVIHVQNDHVFRRYQNEMRRNHGLWPLYRGFFVDLNLFKVNKDRASELAKESNSLLKNPNDSSKSTDGLADENENLMIKLKFLTYKIRTFLIRNGLSILFQGGPSAYKSYYLKQMRIWKTSYGKQKELSKMLDEWAIYILRKYGNRQLSSSTYLSEAEPFLEQYAKRSPANQVLVGAAGNLVRAENFLAIIEGSRDEEGDLHPVGEPLPSSSVILDKVSKHVGLIVFFPGIPGCAKSALCKEILNSPGVLGDNRPVHSPMGDLIKGKYWQIVEAERKKMPYAITLADKNAPNIEVWEQIEKMCRTTKASAVPVVADSEGTDSNPYSLDALAVFIYRVLHRVNHPGKLDKNSDNPGYVLLMFYHLYEGKNRKEFESELYERFGALVKMPLLKTDRNPLPDPVKAILEKGINLYRLHTNKHSRLDPKKGAFARDWSDWEKRLRAILFGNSDYLDSIQVPFDFAVKQVIEQLKDIVKRENQPTPDTEKRKFGNIVYAAVTLPVVEVISLLEKLAVTNLEVKAFLEDKSLESNLKSAHVTLAHKRSHGVAAVASYGAFVQQNVPVQLTGLLLSSNAAALEARLGSVNGEIISSKNEWPHVTIWTAAGTAAKDANLLPQLLSEGKAKQIVIDPPVTVSGVLDFY